MNKTEKIIADLKIYGADIDGAMERLLDDKELYIQCVQIFLDDENFDKLKESINIGDLSSAFDAAHTLKGVAANLGLTPILEAICNIVEPLRIQQKTDYVNLYNVLISSKNKLKCLLD